MTRMRLPDTRPDATAPYGYGPSPTNLADILERVLDKGIVIAGDIKVDLLDIELLTIRLRLFVSSVETAKKAGIDWWETDPALSSRAAHNALAEENAQLRHRLEALEEGSGDDPDALPEHDRAAARAHAPRRKEPHRA